MQQAGTGDQGSDCAGTRGLEIGSQDGDVQRMLSRWTVS